VRFDNRFRLSLPLLLIAVLIAVPASWATGEELQPKDSAGTSKDADTAGTDKAEQKAPKQCRNTKSLSGFSTVEDIQAHDGASEAIVQPPEATEEAAPAVTWRKVDVPATKKTSSDKED
jgi:hypothetical protein